MNTSTKSTFGTATAQAGIVPAGDHVETCDGKTLNELEEVTSFFNERVAAAGAW